MPRNLERENLERYLLRSNPTTALEKTFSGKLAVLARDYNIKTSPHSGWKHLTGYKGQEQALRNMLTPANGDLALKALLGAVPRTALALGNNEVCLFVKNKAMISIVVGRRRLVFENSYRDSIKAQIWQRWSIDKGKKDHNYGNASSKTKSVFIISIGHNLLLSKALEKPVGKLVSENELILFLRWAEPIGDLANRKGTTHYVAIRCERKTRRIGQKVTGSRISCHCYPISEEEVKRDLNNKTELLERLS
ncbi:MAG: hypothetical protein HOB79_21685 [Rhodospirillaceae bacterium]|jgi:hypothetical protein|nr:hypothetical protein [Rhodospirillaceae bacterium]